MRSRFLAYYQALFRHFGPQQWWPAETPFEVMVGAVLAQNTAWKNVERAISNLKVHDLLDPHRLNRIDVDTLALAIRPTGYFNVKAKRLKALVAWFVERYGSDIRRLRRVPLESLREELLLVKGIGPETADSILLYALNRPTFVVDAYTYRVLTRHRLAPEEVTYEEMKELFERYLPKEAKLYNEFHALIVAVGKEYCRTTARCETCPLKSYLPR